MHSFIKNYWFDWFPRLPAYQTFVFRLNQLEPSFQTFGKVLSALLPLQDAPETDQIIDSMPVMLAQNGHSYTARVAREQAMSVIVRRKKHAFTAFACTSSLPGEAANCLCQIKFGSLKRRFTTRKLSKGNGLNYPLLRCSATLPMPTSRLLIY